MEDKGTIENFEHLKPGEGVAGFEYAADLSTQGVQINDPGEGVTISIRLFKFKMNPEHQKHFPTDRQAVFNSHAKQIATILWGDGLIPMDEIGPRVIIDKKRGTYQIFVTCKARSGTYFNDKPKTLSQHLNENPRHR